MDCMPQVHVAAIHAKSGYETFTPGIGALCRGDWITGAGVYRNSYRDPAAYAVIGKQPWSIGPVKIGAVFGGAVGYEDAVTPLVASFVSYGNIHFTVAPSFKKMAPAVVAISFTW